MRRIIAVLALVGALLCAVSVAQAQSQSPRHIRAQIHQLRVQDAGAVYGMLEAASISHSWHCPFHKGYPTPSGRHRCRFAYKVYWSLDHRAWNLGTRMVRLEGVLYQTHAHPGIKGEGAG